MKMVPERQDSFGPSGNNKKKKSPHRTIDDKDVNRFQNSKDNIFVTVRVWPMFDSELMNGDKMVLRVLDNRVIVLFDPDDASKTDLDLKAIGKKRNPEHQYAFDYIFDEDST